MDNSPENPPRNLLFIFTDQHLAEAMSCRQHDVVKTPHLDRLAESGVLFSTAYCNSPICGPSRISMMTGKYVHELEVWCNGVPWSGAQHTWADRLREAGIDTASIGKMDVCGPRSAVGFSHFDELYPRALFSPWPMEEPRAQQLADFHFDGYMYWPGAGKSREETLAGENLPPEQSYIDEESCAYMTGHIDHDGEVVRRVRDYLSHKERSGKSWALHVGLLLPHWPYICPEDYMALYPPESLSLPFDWQAPNASLHPALQHYQSTHNNYQAIEDEDHLRRILSAYYGMVSAMDAMVGELLAMLDEQGWRDKTLVIYASDHGESCGVHGLWDKLTPYEESSKIPLILSGPTIPKGKECATPVSLVDIYPTVLDWFSLPLSTTETQLPGLSLLPMAQEPQRMHSRQMFCEYHGIFFPRSWMMLVDERWKYVWYEGQAPSLFDMVNDPKEMHDLGTAAEHQARIAAFEQALRAIVTPETVAARVKQGYCLPVTADPGTA